MSNPTTSMQEAPEPPRLNEPQFVAELTAHQGVFHAYLTSLLPGEDEVDDILQRVNLVLWEKRSQFEAGTSFRSWGLSVAYWEARAWMAKRKRGDWLVIDDELAQAIMSHFVTQPEQTPNAEVSALRACLGKLKDQDRLLVLSHHQHDKSLRECSAIFDRPADSLKVSLVRIRAALRRCINSQLSVERHTS